MKEILRFYIPIRPVTKKNNMQVTRGANGKAGIRQSKRYVRYEKSVLDWWFGTDGSTAKDKLQVSSPDLVEKEDDKLIKLLENPNPLTIKVNVKAIYGLPTAQRSDLINYHAALHDILTKMGIIEDDHWKIVYSTDGSKIVIDRNSPGTLVIIEAYIDKDGNVIELE